MNLLIGEFLHKMDDKKRLSLPSKIRSQVGESIVLTRGLDNCIFAYPQEAWREIAEQLSAMSLGASASRHFNRFLLSSAVEVEIDKAGRVLIPDNLKEFAKLGQSVVIAGVGNRLEVWAEEAWRVQQKKVESEADALAENLAEIGMI